MPRKKNISKSVRNEYDRRENREVRASANTTLYDDVGQKLDDADYPFNSDLNEELMKDRILPDSEIEVNDELDRMREILNQPLSDPESVNYEEILKNMDEETNLGEETEQAILNGDGEPMGKPYGDEGPELNYVNNTPNPDEINFDMNGNDSRIMQNPYEEKQEDNMNNGDFNQNENQQADNQERDMPLTESQFDLRQNNNSEFIRGSQFGNDNPYEQQNDSVDQELDMPLTESQLDPRQNNNSVFIRGSQFGNDNPYEQQDNPGARLNDGPYDNPFGRQQNTIYPTTDNTDYRDLENIRNPYEGVPTESPRSFGETGETEEARLDEMLEDLGGFDKVQQLIDKRNQLFEYYMVPNKETGETPIVDRSDLKNMIENEQKLFEAANDVLNDYNVNDETILNTAKEVRDMAYENLTAFQNVPEGMQITLKEVFEERDASKLSGKVPFSEHLSKLAGFPTSVSENDSPVSEVPNPFADEPTGPNPGSSTPDNKPIDDALKARNEVWARYAIPDQDGKLPGLGADDINTLLKEEAKLFNVAEDILSNPGNLDKNTLDMTKEIRDLTTASISALQNAPKDGSINADQIIDEAEAMRAKNNQPPFIPDNKKISDTLKARNELIDRYMTPDRNGNLPKIGEEDFKRLLGMEGKLFADADEILSNPGNLDKQTLDIAKEIRDTASANLTALADAPHDGSVDLKQIFADANTKMAGNNVPTAGNTQPRADGFPTSASENDGPAPDVPNPFAGDPVDPYGDFPSVPGNNGAEPHYGIWQNSLYSLYGASAEMDKALDARNKLFSDFLKPDANGNLPKLGSDDIAKLMLAEQQVLNAADELSSRGDLPNDLYRKNLENIRNSASVNVNALLNAPSDRSVDLGQVMTDARTAYVNISPEATKKFGDKLPQNMSMQLQDKRGNQIRGMFTAGDPKAFANQNAMSQMSRMLNCGGIVAGSYPLTIQVAGGQSITGNFTRYVPGSMPGNAQMNDPYFVSNPGMFTNTPALRSVANLNALDYVCGTNGRAPEDMTFRFGADGSFNGVCGMASNQAFMPNPPMGLECVPMMGTNMANAMAMTSPAMVSYNMFNYGMSPDAAQGVVSRMNDMMNVTMSPIPNGINIQIVPNSGWQNINLSITVGDMPQNAPANAFNSLNYVANAQVPYMQQHALEQKLAPSSPRLGGNGGPSNDMPNVPSNGMPNVPASGGGRTAGQDKYESLLSDIHALNSALADASMISGSKEYGNVRDYAKYIEKELKGMTGLMAGPISEKEEFRENHINEMMSNLRDLSEAYIERRGAHTKEKPSNKALIRDSLIRSAHALGSANSDQKGRSSESIFSEAYQRDMYNKGMNKERANAYKDMDPKEVGKLIKRTTDVSEWLQKRHPNVYSAIHNEAQTLLTKYLNKVKDKSPREVGLNKKDMEAVKNIGVTQKKPEKAKTAEKAKTNNTPEIKKQAPGKGGMQM